MKKRFSTFAIVTIVVLSLFLIEQIISENRKIAHITNKEQTKAIEISSSYISKELAEGGFIVFVKKVGEYYYTKDKERIKTVRVTYTFEDRSINVLVDIKNEKVEQVTNIVNYDWMKNNLLSQEDNELEILKQTLLIVVILVIIIFFWMLYKKT